MRARSGNSFDSGSTEVSDTSVRSAMADAAWSAQDRLRTGAGRALSGAADVICRPFEATAWGLRRGLIWPIADRVGPAGRAVGFGTVVVFAAAAGVAGLIWVAPDDPGHGAPQAAAPPAPALASVSAPHRSTGPSLQGAAPAFDLGKDDGPTAVGAAKVVDPSPTEDALSSDAASSEKVSSAPPQAAAAQASTVVGPPAGPAAISVARDFAGAFVLYETGSTDDPVRKTFGETATPALVHALLRRPPRLPANVTVPKAKVLNVVAGPSHGAVYTVSVSLLRVGITSELRLDMEQGKRKRWRVTNVLG